MKRNTESRYRIKLIQEMHLNKSEQKYVDDHKQRWDINYKECYNDAVFKHYLKYKCAGEKFGIASCTLVEVAAASCALAETASDIASHIFGESGIMNIIQVLSRFGNIENKE